MIETAELKLAQAKKAGALIDFRVLACGDDLKLLMSHKRDFDSGEVHTMAWETFEEPTEVAKNLSSTELDRPFWRTPSPATFATWG